MSYSVLRNFITEQEAKSLISYLNTILPAKPGLERSIARFGKTTSYVSHKTSEVIPPPLQYICNKLIDGDYIKEIGQVTVNRYEPGQGIPWHIDSKDAGEIITVLSLASDTNVLFKSKVGIKVVDVPANSLMQFDGDTRYKDQHSVPPVKARRFSIVFRKQ